VRQGIEEEEGLLGKGTSKGKERGRGLHASLSLFFTQKKRKKKGKR